MTLGLGILFHSSTRLLTGRDKTCKKEKKKKKEVSGCRSTGTSKAMLVQKKKKKKKKALQGARSNDSGLDTAHTCHSFLQLRFNLRMCLVKLVMIDGKTRWASLALDGRECLCREKGKAADVVL